MACISEVRGNYLRRLLKKAVQQGRRRVETGGVPSGAHGATNKEHHVWRAAELVRRPGPR